MQWGRAGQHTFEKVFRVFNKILLVLYYFIHTDYCTSTTPFYARKYSKRSKRSGTYSTI